MNRFEGTCERLQLLFEKNALTLKDLVLLRVSLLLGEDAALNLELNWDNIFDGICYTTGTKLEDPPLSLLRGKHRGRPPKKRINLVLKFLLGASEERIKVIERGKSQSEYLSPIRIKDRLNPHYRHAKKKAATYVSTTVGRARNSFLGLINDDPALERLYRLMVPKIQEQLNSSVPKSEEAKRRDFLRKLHAAEIRFRTNS